MILKIFLILLSIGIYIAVGYLLTTKVFPTLCYPRSTLRKERLSKRLVMSIMYLWIIYMILAIISVVICYAVILFILIPWEEFRHPIKNFHSFVFRRFSTA